MDTKPPVAAPPAECACSKAAAPAAAATPTNTTTLTRYVHITLFDCSKVEDVEEGVHMDDTNRFSKWMAGGPAGAAWNVTDLICFADLEISSCEQGELISALRVGQRRVAEQKTAITRTGPQHIQLSAPERAWRSGMDANKADPSVPYRTAVFSLLTRMTCTKPAAEVSSGFGPFHGAADTSAFVAGFAEGE